MVMALVKPEASVTLREPEVRASVVVLGEPSAHVRQFARSSALVLAQRSFSGAFVLKRSCEWVVGEVRRGEDWGRTGTSCG